MSSELNREAEEEIVFISDVHLNAVNPERQENLVSFLQGLDKVTRLYILGDLFDFWFGYKTVIFRYFLPVLCQLMALHKRGCELVYVLGNHDFNLGPLFHSVIPMRVITKEAIEEIDGKKVYLIHGDGIDKSDRGYRILRFIVRSRITIFIFQWLHPDIGWHLTQLLSRSSRRYTSWKKLDRRDVYLAHGRKQLEEGADVAILGHSHNPFVEAYDADSRSGLVINLGDWINHFTYLRYRRKDGFTLLQFDSTSESPSPCTETEKLD